MGNLRITLSALLLHCLCSGQVTATSSMDGGDVLTEKERAYLQFKGRISMCVDPDWMPLEKIKNGKHVGMSADYMEILEDFLDIPIELVPTRDWPQSVAFAKHRKCDIFSLAMPTAERATYMRFTRPYLRIPLVLATHSREDFVSDISLITDRPIGVVKGYAFGAILRDAYPEMRIVNVKSLTFGLDRIEKGDLYGFIGTLATVGFALQNGYPELKIAGKFDQHWELGVGVRNDEPLLFSAFEKAIASVTPQASQAILNRWISVKYVKQMDYTHIWQVLAIICLLFGMLLYRQWLLKKHNQVLHDNQARLHTLVHTIPDLVWLKDTNGVYLACNPRFEAFFGAKETDIIGKTDFDFVSEELARFFCEHDKRAIERGRPSVNEEWITFASDGRRALLETIKAPLLDNKGTTVGVLGIGRDITERKQAENELRESENRFRRLFEHTPAIAVQGYDQQRRVIFWNQASTDLYGYTAEQAIGQRLEDLIIPEHMRAQVIVGVQQWLDGGPDIPAAELRLQRADGKPVHVFSSHVMLSGNESRPVMYCIDIDLTALKSAEEHIRTLSQAVEQSPVSVIITDADSNIEFVNRAFEQSSGYTAEEVHGTDFRLLNAGQNSTDLCREVWQSVGQGNSWTGELQGRRKNGELIHESIHIAPVNDVIGQVRHYLWMKEDISLQKQQEEKILYQAHFDSLTDLPNRFLVLDRLNQLLKEARRDDKQVAVLFLDLDDFKKINDSLGHEIGDKVLVQAAARLNETVRDGDTVGRLGGDEFIILLGGLTYPMDARRVAENLLEQFRYAFQVESRELLVTASVGIAIYPDDGDDHTSLLRHADAAMYHSKAQGCNTYHFFTRNMNRHGSRRLELEEQLHGALSRNELRLYYQPLVSISQRRIIGAEALLRWNSTELGEVFPDEFIPIAEQTGLIIPIGRYVLSQALSTLASWQRLFGHYLKIAVNLSPRQFRDPDLLSHVKLTLDETAVQPQSLELEITEGVLINAHNELHDVLHNLRLIGVGIAMDDFGTGYSSLSYLRRHPFSSLKIDRSFVGDMTQDPADRELVYAAIAMAHSLGLEVVAEGVETEEVLDLLQQQGCDFAQGYLFSPPLPVQEMEKLFAAGKESVTEYIRATQ